MRRFERKREVRVASSDEESSKDNWWSPVDIKTRGSVEGLVLHQNCCRFSCKTDGKLFQR